jgi:hypothetical protein
MLGTAEQVYGYLMTLFATDVCGRMLTHADVCSAEQVYGYLMTLFATVISASR